MTDVSIGSSIEFLEVSRKPGSTFESRGTVRHGVEPATTTCCPLPCPAYRSVWSIKAKPFRPQHSYMIDRALSLE